ncbi:MAG: hypothetical protein WKG00_03845 [Polyangiaceae bacterium]
MQRTHFVLGALGVTASLVLSLTGIGCGSDANPDDATSAGASGGGNQTGAQPPGPPDGAGPGDGAGTVFAIKALYLGDTDRNGAKSPSAWKDYGFNLDGKISTETSTDLCAPRAGGKKTNAYPDGNNGIDNSFGKNVIGKILAPLAPDTSKSVNDEIAQGSFTIMLDIDKLGAGANYNPLVTKLYGGASLEAPPKFDGTDQWPVLRELLSNETDIESAKVQFPKSYLTNNTWVSGTKAPINLSLSVAGFTLQLTIGSAVIAMDINEGRTAATKGIIAGVIETEPFIEELKKVAGAFDPSLCTGTTVESIATQLRQYSDIMADGSAGDPGVECDGISIGLGFDAAKVQLGAIAPKAAPADDPCAATGGAGGSGPGAGGAGGAG